MSIENTKQYSNFLTISLLVISTIMVSPNTLDQTLTLRLVFYSLIISIYTLGLKKLETSPKVFIILFSTHLLLSLFSGFSAYNKEECIFDFFKSTLLIGSIFLSSSFFKQNKFSYNHLFNISWILTLIIGIACFYQICNLSEWDLYQITGLNGHKNLTSSFILLLITIKISYLFFENKSHQKYFIIGFILLDLLIILFLKTRAVWFGISVGIILFFIYYKFKDYLLGKNTFYLTILLTIIFNIILFVFIYLIVNQIDSQKTFLNLGKAEDQERITLWDKTINMINEKPVLGHGGGNWQVNFPKQTLSNIWRAEDLNITFQRPHNDFLWIISELGFLNFEILLFTIILLFSYYLTSNKSNNYLIIIFGLISFFTAGFFDFPRERSEHSFFVFILIGFLISNINNSFFNPLSRKYDIIFTNILKVIFPITFIIFTIRFYSETQVKKIHESINSNNTLDIINAVENSKSMVCSIDSYSVPIKWYSATAYASLGNNKMVLKELKEAYQKAPFNRNVLNDLGTIYTLNGQTKKAIYYFLKSHKISPRYDEPLLSILI